MLVIFTIRNKRFHESSKVLKFKNSPESPTKALLLVIFYGKSRKNDGILNFLKNYSPVLYLPKVVDIATILNLAANIFESTKLSSLCHGLLF